jgi:hypothetical protein
MTKILDIVIKKIWNKYFTVRSFLYVNDKVSAEKLN